MSSRDVTETNVRTIAQMERLAQSQRTMGDSVADAFARVVGSWKFIIIQSCILAIWVVLNIVGWVKHWDPYPFILLNLALSFQAAYASPVIMMSQNRQAKLSERRNHLDLQINLLAEQENTEMLKLLHHICDKLEIPVAKREQMLEENTKPSRILEEIQQMIEEHNDLP